MARNHSTKRLHGSSFVKGSRSVALATFQVPRTEDRKHVQGNDRRNNPYPPIGTFQVTSWFCNYLIDETHQVTEVRQLLRQANDQRSLRKYLRWFASVLPRAGSHSPREVTKTRSRTLPNVTCTTTGPRRFKTALISESQYPRTCRQ